MCVQDATKKQDASNNGDSAPNIEASNQSEKKLKLLCNPQRLPKPKVPRAEKKLVTDETKHVLRDYFWDRYQRLEKYAREVRWIKK